MGVFGCPVYGWRRKRVLRQFTGVPPGPPIGGAIDAGTPRAVRQSRKNGHYSEEGGWSHPCLHGVQGALSVGRTPPRHLHSPSMTFRLWPSAILWAMLTSKHGSQPFPPKGQGQPTFHTRIESVPACLPVEGGAVALLARWISIQ